MASLAMSVYAGMCGWTLARAHARSGDPVAIAAYLGEDEEFDRVMADFGERYADQNEQDYAEFADQVKAGALEALSGV
jgi:sugar/nucleoside kinase (ribokinase family)